MPPPPQGQQGSPAAYPPYDQYHGSPAAQQQQQPPPQQQHHQLPHQMHYQQYSNPAQQQPPPAVPRDNNGDIAMQDAHAGIKYPMRPHHQHHLSTGRADQQPSTAAQRYSPMETLSPTSPYGPKTSQFAQPPSQTQSPNSAAEYPQSPYYPGRQHPPVSPYSAGRDGYTSSTVANLDGAFANVAKTPQRPAVPTIRPVPEFKKVRALSDLQPKNTRQPPFRRANPEGGFISVRLCL